MSWKHFAPVPQEATLSFGGYSFVNPEAWKKYLDKVIREEYPDYFATHLNGLWRDTRWRDQESCILTSLEEYLFHEFGIIIPEENLFKVFNKDGQGLDLSNMLEAISGVIEPLGLEIDRVLAVDPEIRSALGISDRVIDENQGELVDGKPGLCMINVGNGYSHAFFWRKIDRRGLKHEKFRMVVLIKKRAEDGTIHRSAAQSLISFLQFFKEAIQADQDSPRSSTAILEIMNAKILELEKACLIRAEDWDLKTGAELDQHLASLLESYLEFRSRYPCLDQKKNEQFQILIEAGQMLRRIVRESANPSAGSP